MKKLIIWSVPAWVFPFLFAFAGASEEIAQIENNVKTELTQTLRRVISDKQFIVQVNADVRERMVRRLVEGENFIQTNPSSEVKVAPLPGFTPKVSPEAKNPQQSRQVYRMVEKTELSKVSTTLLLDKKLSENKARQAEMLVSNYVRSKYGAKGSVQIQKVDMIAPGPLSSLLSPDSSLLSYLLLGVLGLLLVGAAMAIFKYFLSGPTKQRKVFYPSVEPDRENSTFPDSSSNFLDGNTNQESEKKRIPLALNDQKRSLPAPDQESAADSSGVFPPVPATNEFIDLRSELLQIFLQEAQVFRWYFQKLSEGAQAELYAGLRGPAFDSLLEALDLPVPKGAESANPPSEEQIQFYTKNFSEFISSHEWQHNQFFGFLHLLSDDQTIKLLTQKNPFVSAVMLKYMKPKQSAKVLSKLPSKERLNIICQFPRVEGIGMEELTSIERSVREKIDEVPNFIFGKNENEENFWTEILTNTDNQEGILLDLEKSNPILYQKLAKFRFKLEDMPSLPHPLIQRVLDNVDNEELALALTTVPEDIANFTLSMLSQDRRNLIEDQMLTMNQAPSSMVDPAKINLTKRFREVMA